MLVNNLKSILQRQTLRVRAPITTFPKSVRLFSTTFPKNNVTGFYNSPISFFGVGSIEKSLNHIKRQGFKHPLIVTDQGIVKVGLADKVTSYLSSINLTHSIYPDVEPNPAIEHVNAGLSILKSDDCDCVISIGGGSAHDCAKGLALVASNGGKIEDYEGLDKSSKPQVPLIAINTTAGTASEITRFTIITNQIRRTKMAIVDSNITPMIAVNDPMAMLGMPPSLTAATGMDALTHAIEAYVSTASTPITDTCALKAIDLIRDNLYRAVHDGKNDIEARNGMCYAEYLAGMAFNNASLGYVHAMAHQLGGFYHLAHGVCNAILLPHVQRFNSQVSSGRLGEVGVHLGGDGTIESTINKIVELNKSVGITKGLKELGVKEEDFDILATNAMKDVCGLTNPIQPTHKEIKEIFAAAM